MTKDDAKTRIQKINASLAKLRARAQELTQFDIFGNSLCNQSNMFGDSLPEIRQQVNSLLSEREKLEEIFTCETV